MANNHKSKSNFKTNAVITEDWNSGYKLEVELTPQKNVEKWQLNFNLPPAYTIRNAYGVDLTDNGDGSYTIEGKNDLVDLDEGQSVKPIFIIDHDEGQEALSFELTADSTMEQGKSDPAMSESDSKIMTDSDIAESWSGGYKLNIELTAESDVKDWQVDFNLPPAYTIRNAYGVDLIDNGSDSYTIEGKNNYVDLKAGQSIKPIFIIDHNEKSDLLPEFDSPLEPEGESDPTMSESDSKIMTDSDIAESWSGGYKLNIELTAESDVKDWQVDFNLPPAYTIRNAYGVDLIDNADGSYTIEGQNDRADLKAGQSIKPILIVDHNEKSDLLPEFDSPLKPEGESEPVESDSQKFVPTRQKGELAYGEALQRNFLFFEANRSGDLPPENRIEWRSDSTLNDGSDAGVDLEGGYFDAGDHIKFIQPMAYSSTMLAWGGVDYQEAYQQSGQADELRSAVKWATDWFLKAHETDGNGNTSRLWVQVGDATDHEHWVSPEEIDKVTDRKSYFIDANRPGSDAAAGTASALASASMLFEGVDDAYASELIKNAIALYDFAETYQGKYSDSVPEAAPFYESFSGYYDELSLGAAWLYKATGDSKYLAKAEDYFRNNIGGLGDWTYAADDHSYGAVMMLAKESEDPLFKEQYKKWLDIWIDEKGGVNDTPKGFAIRTSWASIPINQATAFAAEWYNDNIETNSEYSNFATRQVNYVLGENPENFSFMIGFGDNYPLRPHHRGSHPIEGASETEIAQNILHGAIVGGPSKANIDTYNDLRTDVRTNEVGTGYNAPFASAAIQQYDDFGGDPLSESELDMLEGIDASGVGI